MKESAIPMRTCIATKVQKPKSQMIRLVRLSDPEKEGDFIVKLDLKGKERGRGANLDTTLEAFELAIKKKAIERALKLERGLTAEEVSKLREDFIKAVEEKQFRQGNKPVVLRVSKETLESKLNKN